MDNKYWNRLLASGCLVCAILTGKTAFEMDSGGSEYIGGMVTGPLLARLSNGADLFVVALFLTFFYLRAAAIIALLASVMSFPYYVLNTLPITFLRRIFPDQTKAVDESGKFRLDAWSIASMLSILAAVFIAGRILSRPRS